MHKVVKSRASSLPAKCLAERGCKHAVHIQDDRPTRAVVLKDKSVVMLYNVDGEVYCSDANSTAFKYPLTHAKIVSGLLLLLLMLKPGHRCLCNVTSQGMLTGETVFWRC